MTERWRNPVLRAALENALDERDACGDPDCAHEDRSCHGWRPPLTDEQYAKIRELKDQWYRLGRVQKGLVKIGEDDLVAKVIELKALVIHRFEEVGGTWRE